MDLDEIKKIVELMDEHGLSQFKLEQDDTKLELKKGGYEVATQAVPQFAPAPAATAPAAAPAVAEDPDAIPAGEQEITSPMVGTFYLAPNPDSPDFVQIGSTVTAESPVCIIEAMKVMNEIQAEIGGEITKILVENGTAVQYGEPLFRVKTA
ncbi:UNVERIFIED_CONTAM: hypothetical protein GTU68_059787 [Idotea baltica]|nr:hypothetical protein [Idotea baltica]